MRERMLTARPVQDFLLTWAMAAGGAAVGDYFGEGETLSRLPEGVAGSIVGPAFGMAAVAAGAQARKRRRVSAAVGAVAGRAE